MCSCTRAPTIPRSSRRRPSMSASRRRSLRLRARRAMELRTRCGVSPTWLGSSGGSWRCCTASVSRARASRVLPESLPAWLVEGAHRHRAREIPTALARVLTPRPRPRAQATATTARASPRSSRARAPASVASSCLLAARGAHVHVVCRTLAEARETCALVAATRPGASLQPHGADLSDPRDVDALARSLRARSAHAPPRLVAHCAGVMRARRERTPRGDDVDAAVNAFAPAALTAALLDDPEPHLRRAVFVGSFAPRHVTGDARRWSSRSSRSSRSMIESVESVVVSRRRTDGDVDESRRVHRRARTSPRRRTRVLAAVTAHARRLARDRARDLDSPSPSPTRDWWTPPSSALAADAPALYVTAARVARSWRRRGTGRAAPRLFLHPNEARAERGYVYGVR